MRRNSRWTILTSDFAFISLYLKLFFFCSFSIFNFWFFLFFFRIYWTTCEKPVNPFDVNWCTSFDDEWSAKKFPQQNTISLSFNQISLVQQTEWCGRWSKSISGTVHFAAFFFLSFTLCFELNLSLISFRCKRSTSSNEFGDSLSNR